jgi:hypothetical protein
MFSLLSRSRGSYTSRLSIHRKHNIRADHSAHSTAGANILAFIEHDGPVSPGVVICGQVENVLRADMNAQFAALAPVTVDNNGASDHTYTSIGVR